MRFIINIANILQASQSMTNINRYTNFCPQLSFYHKCKHLNQKAIERLEKNGWKAIVKFISSIAPELFGNVGAAIGSQIYHLKDWRGYNSAKNFQPISWSMLFIIYSFNLVAYLLLTALINIKQFKKYNPSEIAVLYTIVASTRWGQFALTKFSGSVYQPKSYLAFLELTALGAFSLTFGQTLISIYSQKESKESEKEPQTKIQKILLDLDQFLRKYKMKNYFKAFPISLISSLPTYAGWTGNAYAGYLNNHSSVVMYVPNLNLTVDPSQTALYTLFGVIGHIIMFTILHYTYKGYTKTIQSEESYVQRQLFSLTQKILLLSTSIAVQNLFGSYYLSTIIVSPFIQFISQQILILELLWEGEKIAKEKISHTLHHLRDLANGSEASTSPQGGSGLTVSPQIIGSSEHV